VLSFGDTFLATAVLIVVTLPLVGLLGRAEGKIAGDGVVFRTCPRPESASRCSSRPSLWERRPPSPT